MINMCGGHLVDREDLPRGEGVAGQVLEVRRPGFVIYALDGAQMSPA